MKYNKEQIFNEYYEHYEKNGCIHLNREQLRQKSKISSIIETCCGTYSNFKEEFDNYVSECLLNKGQELDIDISKIIYKKDNLIRTLKSEKNLLLKQVCTQENMYDKILDNIPSIKLTIERKHIDNFNKNNNIKPGTIILHLSDLHYAEVVEFTGIIYDTVVAEQRLESIINQFIEMSKNYENAVILINGDMVSGSIHNELQSTNEFVITEAVLKLSELLTKHIISIKENLLGKQNLEVIFTVGNHSRTIPGGVYYKNKVKENWEYILGNIVKGYCKNYDIYVEVASTHAIIVPIEGIRFCVTHGDTFRSLNNIRTTIAKFQEMNMSTIGKFDNILIGHFHSTRIENILGGKLFINGALNNINEYSIMNNLSIAKPEQTVLEVNNNKIQTITILEAE